jgi:hypothetical protein
MKHLFRITSIIACLSAGAVASENVFFDNTLLWLNYVGDHPIAGGPWGLHLEVQNRRADSGRDWQQLLVRPGINYALNPNLSVSAGWAYVKTYPYGNNAGAFGFPEQRAWQQVLHTGRAFGLEWQNRLRLEQRWIGEMKTASDVENWRYENRLRYMLRTTVPLTENKKTYLALWDEVFVNFGSNVAGNIFDQNRAFVGVGRKLTDTTRVELGFMEQTLQKRHADSAKPQLWENNHTISLWVLSKWPFGKG